MTKKRYYHLVCNSNGCMFVKQNLPKNKANMEATSHMNMYGHNVSMVKATEIKK